MRSRNEMMPPADAGPVERPVRPGGRSDMATERHELAAAFGAADAAKEQDLRGYYPMAARVLADEARRRRAKMDQMQAEYEDMKSLLLGNVRNVHLEGERAREVLRRMLEAPTTQISTTWKDAARHALRLGQDDLAAIERIKGGIKDRAAALHEGCQMPMDQALELAQSEADTRKPCTCDGAGCGPGRACVVKAGGRLGDMWRCADGLGAPK